MAVLNVLHVTLASPGAAAAVPAVGDAAPANGAQPAGRDATLPRQIPLHSHHLVNGFVTGVAFPACWCVQNMHRHCVPYVATLAHGLCPMHFSQPCT